MNIVHSNVHVVHMAQDGKKVPAPGLCDCCGTPNVLRVVFGGVNGEVACFGCLRAAIVELAEATGVKLDIATEIDGTTQRTRVNISRHEERP